MTRKAAKNCKGTSTAKKTKHIEPSNQEVHKPNDKRCKNKSLVECVQENKCCHNILQDKLVNVAQKIFNIQQGRVRTLSTDQAVQNVLVGLVSRFYPYKVVSPFDRRVTSLAWHPTFPGVLAAGSKGGEIFWCNVNQAVNEQQSLCIPGVGPGGSITAMHFHKEKPTFIYTASVAGKIMLQDFEGKHSQCFLDTFTWENWFASLDVESRKNLLVAGDTKGLLYLMSSKDGTLVWNLPKKIHKSKISEVQFHPLQPDLLVTSSIDHTVKLWDMRKMSSAEDSLCTLQHKKGVNSATFNPSNGRLLLTTDQQSELRVYSGPFWDSQVTIPHPHRQFQHLTPIKASWHPSMDLVVVGRYPDENFFRNDKRCIDFFDGYSGKLKYQLSDSSLSGIVSLNQFNSTGDILASGMGFHVVVWKPKDEDEEGHFRRSGLNMPSVNKKSEKAKPGNVKSKTKSKLAVAQKTRKLR